MSYSVQTVKDILMENNQVTPFWPCHVMHVWGPKGIPKTGVENKSRRVFSHDYKVEHAALSLLNHHGSVTV